MSLIAQALIAATMSQAAPPMEQPPLDGCESGLTQCDMTLKPNWDPNQTQVETKEHE